jgi:hypothetical protein
MCLSLFLFEFCDFPVQAEQIDDNQDKNDGDDAHHHINLSGFPKK